MKTQQQATHQLLTDKGDPVLLERVSITGTLEGYAMQLTIAQRYRNDSDRAIEAVYTFPFAAGATLAGLEAVIGDKRLVGQVLAKAEAEERYEKAINDGDMPVMVERSARGLYTANLGGILPGEVVQVEVTYVQLLQQEDGRIRLAIPTVIAERYGDQRRAGGLQPHQTTHTDMDADHELDVHLRVGGLMASATITSPTHEITQERDGDGVGIALAGNAWLDRDFVLVLGDLPQQPQTIRCPDPSGSAGSARQGAMVLASFTPTWHLIEQRHVDLKLLVDCSGSMAGDSIEQARRALAEITDQLGHGDRVAYSRFGSEVEHVIDALRPAMDEALRASLKKAIRHTEADLGGTEMAHAISGVIGLSADHEATGPTDILLITDGSIWDVEGVIRTCLQSGHRVHAIGVGHSAAESLLQDICQGTGGHCEMVSPGEDLAPAVMRIFKRLRAGQPIAADVEWGVEPLWRSPLPQVAVSGQTLHLMALLPTEGHESAGTHAQLRWRVGDEKHTAGLQVTDTTATQLAKVGGVQRIAQAQDAAIARQLALDYQLVTEQTNLLLVHVRAENEKLDTAPAMQRIAQMPAAGQFGMGTTLACLSAPLMASASLDSFMAFSTCDDSVASAWRTNKAKQTEHWDQFDIPSFLRSGDTLQSAPDTKTAVAVEQARTVLEAFNQAVEHDPDVIQAFASLAPGLVPAWIERQIEDVTTLLGQRSLAVAIALQWLADLVAVVPGATSTAVLSRQATRVIRTAMSAGSDSDIQKGMQQIDSAFGVAVP